MKIYNKKYVIKKFIANIHAWSGAISAIFILIISITGMLIAFSAPLLHIETEAFPIVKERDISRPVDIEKLIILAQQTLGTRFIPLGYLGANAEITTNIEMIYGLSDSVDNGGEIQIVTFNSDDDIVGSLYLDRTITHLLIDLHYELLAGAPGKLIAAIVGLLMVLMAIAGIYLWWPSKQSIRTAVKSTLSIRVTKKNRISYFALHRSIGFFLSIGVVLWGLSGVYWSKPEWGPDFIGPTSQLNAKVSKVFKNASCGHNISIDQASNYALKLFPESKILEAEFSAPWQNFHILYLSHTGDIDKKDGDTRVWVSRQCQGLVYSSSNSALQSIGAITKSIHSGEIFGVFRIPIILFIGFALCILTISGLIIWIRRFSWFR